MKLVLFPNTENQQTIEFAGHSATIGCAEGNTVKIAGAQVDEFHARLIYQNGDWTINDISEQGHVALDGVQISSAKLFMGSKVKIGSVPILVMSTDAIINEVVSMPSQSISAQEMGYTPVFEYGNSQMKDTSIVLARVALIFSLCGPLIIGIGWLIGGIAAITSLLRANNSKSANKTAWWALIISALWVIVISGLFAFGSWSHVKNNVIARNQDAVEAIMKDIAIAQLYIKHGEVYDADKDKNSEYADFEKLAAAKYYIYEEDLDENPLKKGYHFKLKQADENTFICIATPMKYGLTGEKSFWIDNHGTLYSEDLAGAPIENITIKTAGASDNNKNFMSAINEELANDLALLAKKTYKAKEYFRCKKIIDNIRKYFPETAAATQLNTLDKDTEPFIIYSKSKEVFDKAEAFIANNQIDHAINQLRLILKSYASSSLAGKARGMIIKLASERANLCLDLVEKHIAAKEVDAANRQLQLINARYSEALSDKATKARKAIYDKQTLKMMEEEVAVLTAKAHALEAENKYDKAHNYYLIIKNKYGKTEGAKEIEKILKGTRSMIAENDASKNIEEILELDPEENAARILALTDLLSSSYAQTEIYKKNKVTLDELRKKTLAHRYIILAREQLADNSHRSALANFELALKEDLSLQSGVKMELEQCYSFLGDMAYENQEFEQALEYYQKFIELPNEYMQINRQKLMACHYEQAKADLKKGKYLESENHFLACSEQYGENHEYNFNYGKVLIQLKKWKDAVVRLSNSIGSNQTFEREAHIYWALSQYRYALQEEELLRDMIFEDNEFKSIISAYGIDFDIAARKAAFTEMQIKPINLKRKTTFAEQVSSICIKLDEIANEVEKQIYLPTKKMSDKRTSRGKVRTMFTQLQPKMNLIRADQSKDAYLKNKITEQLKKVRKLYIALNSGLVTIANKKATPEMEKFITALVQKTSNLGVAERKFETYSSLEEQRQRNVVSEMSRALEDVRFDSLNSNEIKKNADSLRELYISIREINLAVESLREISTAYNNCLVFSSVFLSEPVAVGNTKMVNKSGK